MRPTVKSQRRRGTALPIVAISAVALMGMTALAIDVGVIVVAKAECQNAADAAAMAGARALNGTRASGAAPGAPITPADNNHAGAIAEAFQVAGANRVLGQPVATEATDITIGKYIYESGQGFVAYPVDPNATNDPNANWSLANVAVSHQGDTSFARLLGHNLFDVAATGTAVHRPRDIALVIDFSGSMRFGSLPGIPHGSASPRRTNNPEEVVPEFGHYSDAGAADLEQNMAQETINGNTFKASNVTASHALNNNRTPLITDFTAQSTDGDHTPAFTSAGDGDGDGFVAGDRPPRANINQSNTYVRTVDDIFDGTYLSFNDHDGDGYNDHLLFERGDEPNWSAYSFYSTFFGHRAGYRLLNWMAGEGDQFHGHTQGPRYWGKTFFLWPPDPTNLEHDGIGQTGQGLPWSEVDDLFDNDFDTYYENTFDWRKRFFVSASGNPFHDWDEPINTRFLWEPDDAFNDWRSPRYFGTTYYRINYRAILKWIREDPNPFPPNLWAGRICYYTEIPDPDDPMLNPRWWNTWPLSDLDDNERFWKEYIDFVLGLRQVDHPNSATPWDLANGGDPNIVQLTGYGDDFAWGDRSLNTHGPWEIEQLGRYMDYDDRPQFPRLHFWFGPMTMVDFIGNYNLALRSGGERNDWMPGTAHEAPLFACKLAIQAALRDIETNHPNDRVTLIFYSRPKQTPDDHLSRFNAVRVPLGRQYNRMIDALWFPPSTLDGFNPNDPPRPFDPDNDEVPRASGGTCYAMGLMLAYNQFSGNPALASFDPSVPGGAGGLGRQGAQKLVIFESDGQPNVLATPPGGDNGFNSLVAGNGENHSHYNILYNTADPPASMFPSVAGTADNSQAVREQIHAIAEQLTALETDPDPGFSTPRKPVKIHAIAFGPLFEQSSAARTEALRTLQQLEVIGNVQSSATPTPTLADYKIVTGSDEQMLEKLRQAISEIMQDGVQVSLIR